MNALTRSSTPAPARLLIASALLAVAAGCGEAVVPSDGILRDLFTQQPIGQVDPRTGDYRFFDGAVIRRQLIELVDETLAEELLAEAYRNRPPVVLAPDLGPNWDWMDVPSGGYTPACTSSCWRFVENTACGQVGCQGCCVDEGDGQSCTCWEECWDYCSESTGGGSKPAPSPL